MEAVTSAPVIDKAPATASADDEIATTAKGVASLTIFDTDDMEAMMNDWGPYDEDETATMFAEWAATDEEATAAVFGAWRTI